MLFPPSSCLILMSNEQDEFLQIDAVSGIDREIQQLLDGAPITPGQSSFSQVVVGVEQV